MSQEEVIVNEFAQTTRDYWSSHSDYDTVNTLLLLWADDDLNVEPEVLKLQSLFQEDFKFTTRIYRIPSDNAAIELHYELVGFIKQHSLERRSLTIVYYAGHADNADNKSAAGYSEWRAKEEGGPALDWFPIQPALYLAGGDVLVILDCCHAALKTRGTKEGRMEVLAACGSGSRVPAPGTRSFTSVLIRQIRKRLKSGEHINIKWLHRHLWGDQIELGLTETPVLFDLSEHDQHSIILQPLIAPPPVGYARKKKPTSYMFLRVSLDDDPQGRQIADWLKSYPPKGIQEVEIEGLILKARSIEDLRTQKAIFSGSILGRLSQLAQIEILQRIRGLSQAISKTAVLASEDDGGADTILHGNAAESAVNDIKNNILNVSNSVESGILLDPNIDLDEAANDEVVEAVGAEDAIALRQYLLDTSHIPNSAEIPRSAVKFVPLLPAGIKPRFRYGQIAEKPVLVEICQYTAISVESLEAPPATVFQLERMVQQLSHPKRTSFNILPCVGYIQERSSRAFGVVFDMDGGCNMDEPPVILSKFYALKRRVPLELRIQLAYTLAVALSNFHQVGWVHKELKSENVLFFKRALDQGCSGPQSGSAEYTDIDLTQPRLFGFECSRPEDAESLLNTDYTPKNNAYRHPQRWGKPMINFEKAHDVYALGIICLEIAYWKLIMSFEELNTALIDPWKIKTKLLARAGRELPHRVGQSFTDVIDACLRFKDLTEDLGEFATHQLYENKILTKLNKAMRE